MDEPKISPGDTPLNLTIKIPLTTIVDAIRAQWSPEVAVVMEGCMTLPVCLSGASYEVWLDALPEPLRSQLKLCP
jgi:hypothetical protein